MTLLNFSNFYKKSYSQ